MSKISIHNDGDLPVAVHRIQCTEDGWGKEHRKTVLAVTLAPGEKTTIDVSGDTRGGGSLVEAYEIQPDPFETMRAPYKP